jgi:hypothetical protein
MVVAAVWLGFTGPAPASPAFVAAIPEVSAMVAEFGRWIADELAAFAKLLPDLPRIEGANRRQPGSAARTNLLAAIRGPHS